MPSAGTWLRRAGRPVLASASAPARPGAALRRPLRHRHRVGSPWSWVGRLVRARHTTRPSPPGEGPFGSRWRCPLPPRSSVLPPGAGDQAKKAVQPKEERAKKGEERDVGRLGVVERHVDAPAVRRGDDGDAAAVLTVEQTQVGLRCASARTDGPAVSRQSTSLRRFRNHPHRTLPTTASAIVPRPAGRSRATRSSDGRPAGTAGRASATLRIQPAAATAEGPMADLTPTASHPRTLVEKIWDDHVVVDEPGAPTVLAIDLHLVHEVTSPQAFTGLRARGLAGPPPGADRRDGRSLDPDPRPVPADRRRDGRRPGPDAHRQLPRVRDPAPRARLAEPGDRPHHRPGAGPDPARA